MQLPLLLLALPGGEGGRLEDRRRGGEIKRTLENGKDRSQWNTMYVKRKGQLIDEEMSALARLLAFTFLRGGEEVDEQSWRHPIDRNMGVW